MIILDVDLKTFNSYGYGYKRVFFIDRESYIEMYNISGEGVLYRYIYLKTFDENDAVFAQTQMQNAVRVKEMSVVGSDRDARMLEAIYQKLDEIERRIRK